VFFLRVALTPRLFQLLATALRLGVSLVCFLPRGPIPLSVSVPQVPISFSFLAASHTNLQNAQTSRIEDPTNTDAHTQAELESPSLTLEAKAHALVAAIPVMGL
jgi:hypothetical protein